MRHIDEDCLPSPQGAERGPDQPLYLALAQPTDPLSIQQYLLRRVAIAIECWEIGTWVSLLASLETLAHDDIDAFSHERRYDRMNE